MSVGSSVLHPRLLPSCGSENSGLRHHSSQVTHKMLPESGFVSISIYLERPNRFHVVVPRQSLGRSRQKSISPEDSDFQKSRPYPGSVLRKLPARTLWRGLFAVNTRAMTVRLPGFGLVRGVCLRRRRVFLGEMRVYLGRRRVCLGRRRFKGRGAICALERLDEHNSADTALQGYLAHKNLHPLRNLY